MSSSDSSDDEETKKISQAIIPDDFLASLSASVSVPEKKVHSNPNGEFKTTEQFGENFPLKSKRPDRNKDDDDNNYPPGYFLSTTPEFRAHVEKHLTKALDSELDANLRESVWKKSHMKGKRQEKGIKLFSDVKVLCLGEDADSTNLQDDAVPKNRPKIKPRKHKLRSSSESSEDEEDKIMSCVFSVGDIEHENRMLENITKTGVDLSGQESKGLISVVTDDPDPVSGKGKKKKKSINGDADDESKPNPDAEPIIQNRKKKLKSRLKDSQEDDVSPVLAVDLNVSPSLHKKKKKMSKDDGQEITGPLSNHKNGHDNDEELVDDNDSSKKKKKKKKKNSMKSDHLS